MSTDIKITNEDNRFKYRVSGIIKSQDKYLIVRMQNNNFYCLPGGHVELGEDTRHAVLRELKEETGFEVKIQRLICITENFFKTKDNKQMHELGFYYILNLSEKIEIKDYERIENDKDGEVSLEFKWVTLNELKELNFKPNFLNDTISNDKLQHIIIKNDEVIS